jgi:glycine cleavage system H protein
MAVLLILATFFVFLVVDWFLNRNKAVPQAHAAAPENPRAGLLSSASIEGVVVPDQLRYHPGHTWCMQERPQLVRVGADALAAMVVGKVDQVELPKPGRWVRQGQKAWSVFQNGVKIDMVSPVEGEIVEINPDIERNPELVVKDPYGKGWLMKVSVPDQQSVERNLMPAGLVRPWMKEAVRAVRARQGAIGAVMVAGGGVANATVDVSARAALVKEVFLT